MMSSFLRWRPGGYLRASGGLFGWLLVRASAQAVLVLLLARLLGAEGYGFFVAVLAVVGFFAPVAGLGLGGLLLRDGAREPDRLQQRLGMALALWFPAVLVFTFVAVLATAWALPSFIPLPALAAFAFAEIASTSFVELAARVEQSQHHVRTFGALQAGLAFARLIGLVGFILLPELDPLGWIWVYAATSLIYTAAIAWRLLKRYCPIWPIRRNWAMAREGFPFTVMALSFRFQAEFNKPLLAQISYANAGNFSVAQRAVDLASLPLQAMLEALWSRLYASENHHRRLMITGAVLVVLALAGGAMLYLAAPLLTAILGGEFEYAADMIRWLAWLPAIQVLRNLMNFRLTAPGRTHLLTWVYATTTVANVLLTSWLVSAYGIHGAAMAVYGCELVLVITLIVILRIRRGKHERFRSRAF
jgi:O-antigen/teichoic acid export membrane protein